MHLKITSGGEPALWYGQWEELHRGYKHCTRNHWMRSNADTMLPASAKSMQIWACKHCVCGQETGGTVVRWGTTVGGGCIHRWWPASTLELSLALPWSLSPVLFGETEAEQDWSIHIPVYKRCDFGWGEVDIAHCCRSWSSSRWQVLALDQFWLKSAAVVFTLLRCLEQIVNGEGIEALLLDSCSGHLLSS